jgi:hypothetical protein
MTTARQNRSVPAGARRARAAKGLARTDGHRETDVDLDALLCALILAPNTFSRNKFFQLFEDPNAGKVRRRATRVRGIIRQLVGDGKTRAQVVGERVMADGQVLIRYHVKHLDLYRSTALNELEAAAMRFALSRAGLGRLSAEDRERVEGAFAKLSKTLSLSEPDSLRPPGS